MVKSVILEATIDEDESEDYALVYTLLSNLPNLEYFTPTNSPCYTLIADALLDSKLNNLKSFGLPTKFSYSRKYVTCALIMRNRLQTLLMVGDGVQYKRLYDRLDQFKGLEEILLKTTSKNHIKELEAIDEKCSGLREVSLEIHRDRWSEYEPPDELDEKNIPLLYTPRPLIHTLRISRDYDEPSPELMSYIVHKYPNLKKFFFGVDTVEIMDKSLLYRFFAYLANIENVELNTIGTDLALISESVGNYWDATSLKQPDKLVDLYIDSADVTVSNESNTMLKVINNSVVRITGISLPYSGYNLEDVNLIVQYGKHVGTLQIYGFLTKLIQGSSEERDTLLEGLVTSSIMFCEKLRRISLNSCDLNRKNKNVAIKRAHLQELSFDSCHISDCVLETFFGGIGQIDVLNLKECKYRNKFHKLSPLMKINVPNTIIGRVSIKVIKKYRYTPKYILISISEISKETSERVENYFKYDVTANDDGHIQTSSRSEYVDKKYTRCPRLLICCRSVTSVQVTYEGKTFLLPETK